MSDQYTCFPNPFFRRALLPQAVFLACLGSAVSPPIFAQTPVSAQAETLITFDIPAGSLDQALNSFAATAGVMLAVDGAKTKGLNSVGLDGQYTVNNGFAALLAGTGLHAVRNDDGGYALREVPKAAGVLKTVKVTAQAEAVNAGYTQERERGYRSRLQTASGFTAKAILDTPFQVNAIPAEVIRDQQAKSLLEVTKNDPSVSEANSALWYDRVNIRGFYLSVDAYHRDGLSVNDQAQMPIENKAAVEINKGLSGLRYGMTSPGGTINYVVKRPTETPTTLLNLFANEFGGRGAHLDAGGRYGDEQQFGVRVNVVAENIQTHIDEVYGDRQFTSLLWDWQVTDKLLLELDYENQQRETTNYSGQGLYNFATTEDAKRILPTLDADTFIGATWARYPTDQQFYGARAYYDINDQWRARVAVQQQYLNRTQAGIYSDVIDPVTGDVDVLLYYSPDQDRDNLGWQAIVDGTFETGVIQHELAFGYDFIERKMTYPDGYYEPFATTNIYDPIKLAEPVYTSDASSLRSKAEQDAVFITDTLSYGEYWQLLAGLRHTKPDLDGYRESATTPTLGVVFKPRDSVSIYTSYAEGIEQGTVVPQDFNGIPYVNAGDVLKPVQSEQFELGVKAEVLSNTLISAAYFDIDKGLQINRMNNGDLRLEQDGSQRHRGIELTATGELSESLRLMAGITRLDAEIADTDNEALRGKRPLGIPETQANVFVDYQLQQWAPGLAVNAGIYYAGDKMVDDANTFAADAYTRWDLGARYRLSTEQNPIILRLTIENVTDKTYVSNTTWSAWDIGAPRTIKLSAEFSL